MCNWYEYMRNQRKNLKNRQVFIIPLFYEYISFHTGIIQLNQDTGCVNLRDAMFALFLLLIG